jgi:hypothetical protein
MIKIGISAPFGAESSKSMQRLNRRPSLTRAQNAFLNPVSISSERAHVTKVWGQGLTTDDNNVALITVSVLTAEKPGQPIRLTAKDSLATLLNEFAEAKAEFSFEANISGNPIPYLFATYLAPVK